MNIACMDEGDRRLTRRCRRAVINTRSPTSRTPAFRPAGSTPACSTRSAKLRQYSRAKRLDVLLLILAGVHDIDRVDPERLVRGEPGRMLLEIRRDARTLVDLRRLHRTRRVGELLGRAEVA